MNVRSLSSEARALAGIGVALWIVGVLVGAGIALLVGAITQEHKNAQFTYAINRASCAAYSLVDPTIKANTTLITVLDQTIRNPASSTVMVNQAKIRRKAVVKQTIAFQSFRAIYGTIPSDFDCRRLSKQPPT